MNTNDNTKKHNQCIDSFHGSLQCNQAVLFLIAELQKKGEKHIDWETEGNKGR